MLVNVLYFGHLREATLKEKENFWKYPTQAHVGDFDRAFGTKIWARI